MKKRTWFVLIMAFLLIITGASGSIFYFQKLEAERAKSDVNKKFKYDNSEELVLNVKNRATLYEKTRFNLWQHERK
jgi:flagellar basal body-associated protein FliL